MLFDIWGSGGKCNAFLLRTPKTKTSNRLDRSSLLLLLPIHIKITDSLKLRPRPGGIMCNTQHSFIVPPMRAIAKHLCTLPELPKRLRRSYMHLYRKKDSGRIIRRPGDFLG